MAGFYCDLLGLFVLNSISVEEGEKKEEELRWRNTFMVGRLSEKRKEEENQRFAQFQM